MSNFALAEHFMLQGFLGQGDAQYEHCLAIIVRFSLPVCLGLSGPEINYCNGTKPSAELLEKSASIFR